MARGLVSIQQSTPTAQACCRDANLANPNLISSRTHQPNPEVRPLPKALQRAGFNSFSMPPESPKSGYVHGSLGEWTETRPRHKFSHIRIPNFSESLGFAAHFETLFNNIFSLKLKHRYHLEIFLTLACRDSASLSVSFPIPAAGCFYQLQH